MSPRRWVTSCLSSPMRTFSGSSCRRNDASNCSSDASPTLTSVSAALATSRLPRNPSTTPVTSPKSVLLATSLSSSETSSAANESRLPLPSDSWPERLSSSNVTLSIFCASTRCEFSSAFSSPSLDAMDTSCCRSSVCSCCKPPCNAVCSACMSPFSRLCSSTLPPTPSSSFSNSAISFFRASSEADALPLPRPPLNTPCRESNSPALVTKSKSRCCSRPRIAASRSGTMTKRPSSRSSNG